MEGQKTRRSCSVSFESDMSIDDPNEENFSVRPNGFNQFQPQSEHHYQHQLRSDQETSQDQDAGRYQPSMRQEPHSFVAAVHDSLKEPSSERDERRESDGFNKKKDEEPLPESAPIS
ncbi:hypothetical protein IFM89_016529 [Coptis chinensis]|uniref:Uncharacterized protein n=1 Tax=Coptis chinensis TaxID=261450 RepID=A0A835ILD3_9MAGN|nr:hypothetical protein IFM89_016529 [Coptis chinensis]